MGKKIMGIIIPNTTEKEKHFLLIFCNAIFNLKPFKQKAVIKADTLVDKVIIDNTITILFVADLKSPFSVIMQRNTIIPKVINILIMSFIMCFI